MKNEALERFEELSFWNMRCVQISLKRELRKGGYEWIKKQITGY